MKCSSPEIRLLRLHHLQDLRKENFRKSIHLCAFFVPLMLRAMYWPTIFALLAMFFFYLASEILRFHGVEIPLMADVTMAAARKRDENRIVLGPITLSIGILLTALIFKENREHSAAIASLALGDGIASVVGKRFGRTRLPFRLGKTAEGSLACFAAMFFASFLFLRDAKLSLFCATLGSLVEALPLKDLDNILIPLCIASLIHFAPILQLP